MKRVLAREGAELSQESVRLPENRIGAVCAIAGAILLLAGTWLHPMPADPNNAVQAFAAYADDRLWVASHLAKLVGIALALAALVILARQLETGGAAVWARVASTGAIASLALAAALQAVDGIALRAMVENYAAVRTENHSIFCGGFASASINASARSGDGIPRARALSLLSILIRPWESTS